jgi:adenine-specific DNA-methyltransferase
MHTTQSAIRDVPTPAYFPEAYRDHPTSGLMERLDFFRLDACRQLEQSQRGEFGQFLTPDPVARLMASMFQASGPVVSILDAGAGIGSLFAAAVAELCGRPDRPQAINVTAYEINPLLLTYLKDTVDLCRLNCERVGVRFAADIRPVDFIKEATSFLSGDLFGSPLPSFTAAILNPPYRKINSDSDTRHQLRTIGIETSNIYTGFLATTVKLLAPDAELVTITPRSFCNGTYFRGFREAFLRDMSLRRIHLFDSRQEAFRDDAVLQETVIVHAVKSQVTPSRLAITSNSSAEDDFILARELPYREVIHPNDPERFIRVVTDGISEQIVMRMQRFTTALADLELTVSTGRVVDFRAREYLQPAHAKGAAPLLYPVNIDAGVVVWPKQTKKAQSLTLCQETESLFVPNGTYVLVKRFSSKEQNRRVVSAVFSGQHLPTSHLGFENHLNYYHQKGRGIDLAIANGLSLYLNSTLVDAFFRQFNGHTQVNATDLRSLKYPNLHELEILGRNVQATYPTQEEIDRIIEKEFFGMADISGDPIATKRRIEEATDVLVQLGLPRAQLNERSALTLLALLGLSPSDAWSTSTQPLRGITPIMEFIDTAYGKRYAPNARETVRRQTVHQFLDAGLITENPDEPDRPVNSPKAVYQLETGALELIRTYGTAEWFSTFPKSHGKPRSG